MAGREEVSLSTHSIIAPEVPPSGFRLTLIAGNSLPFASLAVRSGGAPNSLLYGICTNNAVYSVVKLHEGGIDPLTYFPVERVVLVYAFPMFSKKIFNFWSSLTLR